MADAIERLTETIERNTQPAEGIPHIPIEPAGEFEPVIEALAAATAQRTRTATRVLLSRCESPAEKLFLVSMVAAMQMDGSTIWFEDIAQQVAIAGFRADFVVRFRFSGLQPWFRAVVEIDGHEFHEKTKEQASRDKRKDRALQASGYFVLRFSGSDVYRDGIACANEVLELLSQKAYDDMTERGLH